MHEGNFHMHQTYAQVERRSMWCTEEEQSLGGSDFYFPQTSTARHACA